ncbi:MAG TPA: hypothetical protein VGE60_02815 [Telluria sp.]
MKKTSAITHIVVAKTLFAVSLLLAATCGARADSWLSKLGVQGDTAFRAGHYDQAYKYWSQAAFGGGAEYHEKLGTLLLGPHAKSLKPATRNQESGIRHIYIAAVAGRAPSMRILANALRRGAHGARKLPAAADCWTLASDSRQAINKCIEKTEFNEALSRPSCGDLVFAVTDGPARARLCVANRTPALFIFSPPPGERDMMRVREYEKHGIELMFAGDVYSEERIAYVTGFNNATVEAIDAREGTGYLQRLSEKIELAIEARYPTVKQ